MDFPTLFPAGDVDLLHPCIWNIEMHECVFNLLKFYNKIFGIHTRFQYFLLNVTMEHRSQGKTSFFLKQNIHENGLATIDELHKQHLDLSNNMLDDKLMHFGSSPRGID